jgi:hypothetical protein
VERSERFPISRNASLLWLGRSWNTGTATSLRQTQFIMSLHAPDYNKSEYNNRIPSHLLFQQRCRSRYSRAMPSSSTSSTGAQQQPHFYTSTTSSDSLSSLLKLIKHHHYLQLAKGQLAVPSSRSCRPISATSTSRRRPKQSHNFASARPSPKKFINIDIR